MAGVDRGLPLGGFRSGVTLGHGSRQHSSQDMWWDRPLGSSRADNLGGDNRLALAVATGRPHDHIESDCDVAVSPILMAAGSDRLVWFTRHDRMAAGLFCLVRSRDLSCAHCLTAWFEKRALGVGACDGGRHGHTHHCFTYNVIEQDHQNNR